jgi:hypothetical protein
MANFRAVLKQLQKEHSRAQAEVQRMDEAIQALQGLGGNGRRRTGRRPAVIQSPRRRMSKAARKRIAAAQRARWAKLKGKRLGKARRRMSKAARNRMAAAQRARWANTKQEPRKRTPKRPAQAVQGKPANNQKAAV